VEHRPCPFRSAGGTGCADLGTNYPVGSGPALIRMPANTEAQRTAWLARARALRAAGFYVEWDVVTTLAVVNGVSLSNSHEAQIEATCR
jgi:hypothetical protein